MTDGQAIHCESKNVAVNSCLYLHPIVTDFQNFANKKTEEFCHARRNC